MRKRIIRRTSISESRVVRRAAPAETPLAGADTTYRVLVVAEDANGSRSVYERGPFGAVDVEEGTEGNFRLVAK